MVGGGGRLSCWSPKDVWWNPSFSLEFFPCTAKDTESRFDVTPTKSEIRLKDASNSDLGSHSTPQICRTEYFSSARPKNLANEMTDRNLLARSEFFFSLCKITRLELVFTLNPSNEIISNITAVIFGYQKLRSIRFSSVFSSTTDEVVTGVV